jgi:hypothetical protein
LWDLVQPENTYDYLDSEDIRVQSYGDVAVVSLRVRAAGRRGEAKFEGVFRNIRLFVKSDKGWQCAVWFNTRVG